MEGGTASLALAGEGTATVPPSTAAFSSLQFHSDIVDELLGRDGLTVMAEGMGLSECLAGLLHAHAREHGAVGSSTFANLLGTGKEAIDDSTAAKPARSSSGAVLLLGVNDAQKHALRVHLRRVSPGTPFPPEVTAEFAGGDRQSLYLRGGPMFVTTRIAAVDMLTERLPPASVAGLVVANGHRITDASGEAFVVRLFRAGNRRGFVRALTDRPGELVRGFNSIERAMKALMVRNLNLWPRFHLGVRACLDAHAPEVIELRQPLTPAARRIQEAIVDVMRACMDELKRSRHVDTSELTVEAGLFKSFDRVLQRQLDPVWHVVTRKLKQIVYDLRTLRNLATYLLRYDAVTFLRYLETLRVAEGRESVWLYTDAAHTIFEQAKRRVYVLRKNDGKKTPGAAYPPSARGDDDDVEIVREVAAPEAMRPSAELDMVLEPMPKWPLLEEILAEIDADKAKLRRRMLFAAARDADAVDLTGEDDDGDAEVEFASQAGPSDASYAPTPEERYGQGPTLVVAKDETTASQLVELIRLGSSRLMDAIWAQYLIRQSAGGGGGGGGGGRFARGRGGGGRGSRGGGGGARGRGRGGGRAGGGGRPMSRMDRMRAAMMGEDVPSGPGPSAGGRGGGRGRGARGGPNPTAGLAGAGSIAERTAIAAAASHLTKERSRREREAAAPAVRAAAEAGHKTVAGDLDPEGPPSARPAKRRRAAAGPMRSEVSDPNADAFDDDVEIVRESDAADELATRGIHVHALSDRGAILATLNPSFVVVYDPDAAFIREIETHKASRPGAPMRVYFLVHDTSLEEQRYLSSVRYETEAFDGLVRAKQHMAMPAEQEGRVGGGTGIDETGPDGASTTPVLPLPQLAAAADRARESQALNTRVRGGQLTVPTRLHVVVDVREFMSSLPSILHQSAFKLMPVTLEVGDYVLSPDICVERKSVPDLIGSLQSGRLYNQAESMSKHYKMPVLLIEFEREKSFALQALGDMSGDISLTSTQSRLCLLVIAFPRLRIMWSRSLHATAEMFAAFKIAEPEPTVEQAAAVGVPQSAGEGRSALPVPEEPFNQPAIDFIRRLPGVTEANYRRVIDAVESPAKLAEMTQEQLARVLGDARQAKTLHEFIHAPFPTHAGGA